MTMNTRPAGLTLDERPRNSQRILVVLNPVAGHMQIDTLREALHRACVERGWSCEVHETAADDDVAAIVRAACERGADIVVAAGGDGTVTQVVNGMMSASVALGILPVGTGNGLARALGIPLTPDDALALLTGEYELQPVDVLQIEDRAFLLDVSAGISARAMRDTSPEHKQRFGISAYVWTLLREVVQRRPQRFVLSIDGTTHRVRATEILVTNGAPIQTAPITVGAPETYADGQLNVYILSAHTILHYLRLGWQLLTRQQRQPDDLRILPVHETIRIDAVRRPQPVQADGELIGRTPVVVRVLPRAISVIVPKRAEANTNIWTKPRPM